MRKRTIAVGVAALIALTGCSSTAERETTETASSAAETTSAGEGPRGFQFESGFLGFGDFDPDTLGDDIFNPCTEITPEEYAAAGFGPVIQDVELDEILGKGLSHCYLQEFDESAVARGFANSRLDAEALKGKVVVMPEYASELMPEMIVYNVVSGGPGSCFTQIDTKRGGFGTLASGTSNRATQQETCNLAVRDLETLFRTFGTGRGEH